MKKPKHGDRYLNPLGEYCIIKNVSKRTDIIKIQICGGKRRTEPWRLDDFMRQTHKFVAVPYPKINRTNISRHLLEYQLNMIGRTTVDTKTEPEWFEKWTISSRDFAFFQNYAIPLLKKTFKFNSRKAHQTFNWFVMQFGLKKLNDDKRRLGKSTPNG